MLKNIPTILTPELLKIMMEMGHGDKIVIGDGNFPAASIAQRLVRLDGNNVNEVLDAMLQFLPIDDIGFSAEVMRVDKDEFVPLIWGDFENTISKYEDFKGLKKVERFDFYDKANMSYAVVSTGETQIYANIIITKGVVK